MKRMKKSISILVCALMLMTVLTAESASAQGEEITEVWVARYSSPGSDWGFDITTDSSGNVYVAGMGGNDFITISYAPSGAQLWAATYNGLGNGYDGATAIAIDDSTGNVYVTGTSTGTRPNYDFATVAYDSIGNELWVARYDEAVLDPPHTSYSADDRPWDIAVGPNGNVYVTGWSYNGQSSAGGTHFDYVTIAYDPQGNELWVARYNGPVDYFDMPAAMAVDESSGNVYVTGHSIGGGATSIDYATVAYDADGNELWVARYDGPGNRWDYGRDITVGPSEIVYVTGESNADGTNFNYDYATIAYDSSGNELWVTRHDGPGNLWDAAYAIAADPVGNVYVTGFHWSGTDYDYATIAYDVSGNELWTASYDGTSGTDWARDLALDDQGNVYVTGRSQGSGTDYDYGTVAYDPSGNELWVARYNGPGNGLDWGWAIATGPLGSVYVTGRSLGSGTGYDSATVKYSTVPTPDDIDDYIQNLPDECLKNGNPKIAFHNKLADVQAKIDADDYQGAIDKLENDILDKVDKWVTCPDAQQDLYGMIDALIEYLEGLV